MATKRIDPQPLLHLQTAISDVNTCKVNVYKILELLVVYSHCKGRADAAGSHGRFLFLITFFVVGRQGTQFTYPGGHSSHTPETKFARGIKSCTPTRLQTRTGRGRSSESRRSRGTQSGTQSIGGGTQSIERGTQLHTQERWNGLLGVARGTQFVARGKQID
jgi:hypothetical protein